MFTCLTVGPCIASLAYTLVAVSIIHAELCVRTVGFSAVSYRSLAGRARTVVTSVHVTVFTSKTWLTCTNTFIFHTCAIIALHSLTEV